MLRALLLSLVLVLAACGGASGGASFVGDGRDLLSCGDATWPEGGLDDLPALDTLPEDVLAAVDDMGEPVVDRSLPWRVATHDGPDVVLVRALEPNDPDAADGATHASLSLFRVDRDPTIPPGTWHYASGDVCTPRLAAGNQGGRAEVRLADTPSPSDTSVQLAAMERACASGRSAEERIVVDELTLTADEVRLRVSVTPPPGDAQDCQGNPWTPFEVDLGEPLGDWTVVDANLVPAAELVVGTAEPEPFDPETEPLDEAVERAVSFTPWPDYTVQVGTTCFCSGGTYEVVVREGEIVARRSAEPRIDSWDAAGTGDPDPYLAPSLVELQERIATAYEDDPASITELVVDETGTVLRVGFDPSPTTDDDEVAYQVFADVDSPSDPIDQER